MTIHYQDQSVTLHQGDCLDVLRTLPDNSVDSVCTDPPYGLGFMGKAWDALPPGRAWAEECLRVLKPGGHLLAFGGTRTNHRLACAVEDAGFEIRDSIAWLYGSGFPKSLDVSKAIDKAAGAHREVIGVHPSPAGNKPGGASLTMSVFGMPETAEVTTPATDDARTWQGWGTALKPAHEPIVVARKPLAGSTVAANVLAHGTGALNVDGCRVGDGGGTRDPGHQPGGPTVGRWPANVVLDESQAEILDEQSGERKPSGVYIGDGSRRPGEHSTDFPGSNRPSSMFDDSGGASRFFYVAKADASERVRVAGVAHPTVKPIALMRWLVRLVTPVGGTVLEPFAGSGTTVEACILEGFRCVAIERETDYLPLIVQRINRRRDPLEAVRGTGEDMGLFEGFGSAS